MDEFTSRLQQLEVKVNALTEENAKNKITMRENEKALSQHTTRIIDLESNEEVLRKEISHLKTQLQEHRKQMDSNTNNVASIEHVKKMFEFRLNDTEEKAERSEGTLKDVKKQLDLLTNKVSCIEHLKKRSESPSTDVKTTNLSSVRGIQKQMDSLSEKSPSIAKSTKTPGSPFAETVEKTMISEATLREIQNQMDLLTNRVSAIEQDKKVLESRSSDTEGKAEHSKGALREAMARLDSLTKKVSSVEHVGKAFESLKHATEKTAVRSDGALKDVRKQMDLLREKVSTTSSEVVNLRARSSFHDDSLTCIQGEIAKSKLDISTLKFGQDAKCKTAFNVILEGDQEENNQFQFWLGRCKEVSLGHNYFHGGTFTAPTSGIYLFHVTICQTNHGKLEVAVLPKPRPPRYELRKDMDGNPVVLSYVKGFWCGTASEARSGSILMDLSARETIGVYIRRLEGQAKVDWCRFSGCLLFSS